MTHDSIPFEKLLGMTEEEFDRLARERWGLTPDEMEERAYRELMDMTDGSDDW